jgi:thioredoxin reductase (NADPH)
MDKMYDLIIIGSGPAGMAAAIYAKRAQLNFVILERTFAGGQIINTYEVENYPGIKTLSGMDLSNMFREHVESLGASIDSDDVVSLDISGKVKRVITTKNTYETKTIILATGATWKKLGAEGEEKFTGRGVSYCATCDGAFYKDKEVVVVGGGDVAVEDAIYLARICKKVYLVHRRDELRAVKGLQERLFTNKNVEILWDSELDEIYGDEFVEGVTIYNNKFKDKTNIKIDGVFVAVGTIPNSQLLNGKVEMDDNNWVITDEWCMTNVEGVFAAGDVRKKVLKQVITAASDGAIATYGAERFI